MKFIYNNPIFKPRRKDLRKEQTEAEEIIWKMIRKKKLEGLKFYRQYSIGPCILDFYCPSVRLAIEVDGGQHSMPEQKTYDLDRTSYLKSHDIKVIRFWNQDILNNKESALNIIRSQLLKSK
jgi:very-short-patch-repair endonuclease